MPAIHWPELTFGPVNLWSAPVRDTSIPSPCIKQCRAVNGVCAGCGRTVEEIAAWSYMTNDERRDVIKRLDK